jgi:hypothetical protein
MRNRGRELSAEPKYDEHELCLSGFENRVRIEFYELLKGIQLGMTPGMDVPRAFQNSLQPRASFILRL